MAENTEDPKGADEAEKKAVQTRLEYDEYIDFNVAASKNDLSKSALLRQLIDDFLEEERDNRENEGNGIQMTAD